MKKSRPEMTVLITHAYHCGSNGDAALAAMTIAAVREQFPEAQVVLSSMESPQASSSFEGVPNIGAVTLLSENERGGLVRRVLRKLYLLVAPLVWASLRRFRIPADWLLTGELQQLLEHYEVANLIVGCAGGYLTSPPGFAGTLNVMFLVSDFAVGLILRKPLILYSQSIGPFGSRWQRRLVHWVLRRSKVVMVRESTSASYVRSLRGVRVDEAVDAAFALTAVKKRPLDEFCPGWGPDGYRYIGLTAREFLEPGAQAHYEAALASFIDQQTADGRSRFVLIPQVVIPEKHDDDREIHARIKQLVARPEAVVVLNDVYDYRTILELYGSLDYLVGTRFHSAIFSMLANVPIIAIEYEYKTSGIMRDLGLSDWVLAMRGLQATELNRLFAALVESRTEYLDQLSPQLEATRRRALKDREQLRRAFVGE